MSASEVRRKSQELQDKARRRLIAMYLMGATNAGFLVILMWFIPELRVAFGYLVLTAAMLVFFVQRRSRVRPLSPDITVSQGLTFYRQLLERERDFRRHGARWFSIGPGLNIVVLTLVYMSSPLFHGAPAEIGFIAAVLVTHVIVLTQVSKRLTAEASRYQAELERV